MISGRIRRDWFALSAALLFVVLFAELFFSVRQYSATFDEPAHIYAGYSYWKHKDFGINPEHPPLAKMVARESTPSIQAKPSPMHCRRPPPKGK